MAVSVSWASRHDARDFVCGGGAQDQRRSPCQRSRHSSQIWLLLLGITDHALIADDGGEAGERFGVGALVMVGERRRGAGGR